MRCEDMAAPPHRHETMRRANFKMPPFKEVLLLEANLLLPRDKLTASQHWPIWRANSD
jgi:hypothetical protein